MNETQRVLIVDDEPDVRTIVTHLLEQYGFSVEAAGDGRAMMDALKVGSFDIVLLDLMLPGEDGLSLCRRLRSISSVPVIMMTAMGEETDRIVGLEVGADDYIGKPFNPRELLARVKAVLRRTGSREETTDPESADVIAFEGWRLDTARRELYAPDGTFVLLTAAEYDLLLVFVERPNRVLSRDQLLDFTKGRTAAPFDRSIDVQLSRLRRKIEQDPKNPTMIKTVRGAGYVFSGEVTRLGRDAAD